MIKTMFIIPNPADATSFYRGAGPLSALRKQIELDTVMPSAIDWWQVDLVDMIFLQRPCTDAHLKLVAMGKRHGKPIWVDYDDLLFDIPDDNPAYDQYMNESTKHNIAQIIQLADVVTVSTEQLKRCFQLKQNVLNKEVHVIPNAIPDRFFGHATHKHKKHLNWRGSNTHQADLAEYGGEVIDLAEEHVDATFTFIGYNPWFMTRSMGKDQAIIVPEMTIDDYFDFMIKTSPAIQLVPLADNLFNRCKSNIAWIEATIAGAVCVAPDWQEWQKPGVLTYKDSGDFKFNCQMALKDPTMTRKSWLQSLKYISENLLLSQVNKKREVILQAMFNKSRGLDFQLPPGGGRIPETEEVMELE